MMYLKLKEGVFEFVLLGNEKQTDNKHPGLLPSKNRKQLL